MTHSTAARSRLVLCVATGILLLACTVAAWVLPRPIVGAEPVDIATSATASVREDPCDLIVGPARDSCSRPAVETTEPVAAAVSTSPTDDEQALWLLLFSTVAIAAAIGLAITTGRSHR
ncbi:hypothetical protein OHT93_36860 [Streptomyces sp. NBC_00191]|uniref:hypothetical protein n=1 Tax=Streptomyces sp. NBC_00191 TaxID=2975674 RepID=UPI003249D897